MPRPFSIQGIVPSTPSCHPLLMESPSADFALISQSLSDPEFVIAPSLLKKKSHRQPNDYYPTPYAYVQALLSTVPIRGRVFDPCDGGGAISKHLDFVPGVSRVIRNELYPVENSLYDYVDDATQPEVWRTVACEDGVDWAVFNPPFNAALPMLKYALATAQVGVAALLRLSFLEPTKDRGPFLKQYPPTKLIILPRVKFVGKGSDSVTCAWVCWERHAPVGAIGVVER